MATEADSLMVRVEIALNSALNMVEGDGMPPDWDYLRMIRKQVQAAAEQVRASEDGKYVKPPYDDKPTIRLTADDERRLRQALIDSTTPAPNTPIR